MPQSHIVVIRARSYARCPIVTRPAHLEINHILGMGVFELKDYTGTFFEVLSCLDDGTRFSHAWNARVGDTIGPPSSSRGLKAFCDRWAGRAGWHKHIRSMRPRSS